MYLCLKEWYSFHLLFLFQQKVVFSQTNEEQILTTADNNIVKVLFKLFDT